jgi:hypothetical protein
VKGSVTSGDLGFKDGEPSDVLGLGNLASEENG